MRFVFFYKIYRYFAKAIHNSAPSTPQALIVESFERGDSHDSNDIKNNSAGVDHAELRMVFAGQSTSEKSEFSCLGCF